MFECKHRITHIISQQTKKGKNMKIKIILVGVLALVCTILLCYSASRCPKSYLHVTGNGYEMNHSGCVDYKTKQNVSVKKHANCLSGAYSTSHCGLETITLTKTTTYFEDVRCNGKVLNTTDDGQIAVRSLNPVACNFKPDTEEKE